MSDADGVAVRVEIPRLLPALPRLVVGSESGLAMARERGQATVELLAAIPLLLIAGAIALQLLLVGYALTLADGAAEAGALALAAGRTGQECGRGVAAGVGEERGEVAVRGGEVTFRLLRRRCSAVSDRLAVTSSSYARPGGSMNGRVILVTAVGTAERIDGPRRPRLPARGRSRIVPAC